MRYCLKILLLLFAHALTLNGQLQIKNYFTLVGRRDVGINAITQDKIGFLWLGTAEGLYKFDGIDGERVLPHHSSLATNITALHCDDGGRIWIGTEGGKVYCLFRDQLDSIDLSRFKLTERITAFLTNTQEVLIGTYGNGLIHYTTDTVKLYDVASGMSDNVIYCIEGDIKRTVWCGTDAGISQLQGLNSSPQVEVISSKDGLPDNIVRKVHRDDDRLLVTMQDSGVCYFDLGKKQFSRNPFFSAWTLGAVFDARSIGDKMYIATERQGLIEINRGALTVYKYDDLQVGRINSVFFDNAQQVWIASPKGLTRLSEKRLRTIGSEHGLTDKKVLALATDNNNAIWIGTTQGVSKVMTDDQGKIVVHKYEDLSKYTISCAAKAPDGNIWFGTYGSGVIILSAATGGSSLITSESHSLTNDNISGIHFGTNRQVYLSTLGGGLIQGTAGETKLFEVSAVYNEDTGLGSNYVYAATTDKYGKLYAATDGGGLEVLHRGKFLNLTKKYRLKSSNVFSLCVDLNNNVWAVSSADGVLRYDRKRMRLFTRREGLRDEQPAQLVASGGHVYAVHSKGIDRINIVNSSLSYYDVPDNTLEPNLNAAVLARDHIYSGTNNGVLVIRTSQIATDSARPSVYIKSLRINYRNVNIDSSSVFSYDQNNVAIAFGGIWLKDPEKLQFRYMLQGQEKVWQSATQGKEINYNNLRPGKYMFVVQARNEEEVWSYTVGYTFTIEPPVWQRWWFWAIVLGALALAIWLFITYRLKALQRENVVLERKVLERTSEIEKQKEIIEVKNIELEQLSLVASKTDNVVLILDKDGKLEYVNESFTRQHNMEVDQVKRKYGETIFELSNNPDIRELVDSAVTNKRSVNYESLNRMEEGGKGSWQSSTLTPIFSEDGNLKKIIIIDTDVTDRKRQEQIILQKNKDITDSIYYAKKIQHAILPSREVLSTHLPAHFCLYLTKDIVSGDFYWFSHLGDYSVIAAVDCTGHGVPGAFMSLIGYNLLNRIVNEQRTADPASILLELNKGVITALHKNDSESRDGMDIAICKINHRENTLEYAGSMRPLWIINGGEFAEIRADKIPIGTRPNDRQQQIKFVTHTITPKPGDRFFIFTDGYADQFGGEKDKKFSTSRFKSLLCDTSSLDLRGQENALKKAHLEWKGDHEQIDDILVIGFEMPAQNPSSRS